MSDGATENWPPAEAPYYAHPGDPPAVARLSSAQTAALRALVAGKSLNQAAADAGVDRTTLYRWRTHDPDFIEALADWRVDIDSYCRDRMMAIADDAIEAVAAGVKKGDARLAFRLLLDLGRSARAQATPALPQAAPAQAAPLREHPQAQAEKEIDDRLGRAYQKSTDEQLTRMPELIAEIIEIDNARRAGQAKEVPCGDVSMSRNTVDALPINLRQEEALVDEPPVDVQSDEPLTGEATQSDERLPVEAPPSNIPCVALTPEPAIAASTDTTMPQVSTDTAAPQVSSDAASAAVVPSVAGGTTRELTLGDILRMEAVEHWLNVGHSIGRWSSYGMEDRINAWTHPSCSTSRTSRFSRRKRGLLTCRRSNTCRR
jgi:hypothetical protein